MCCREDRWIWVEVLKKAKNAWQGLTPTAVGALHNVHSGRVRDEDDEFLERLANVRETLIQKETPSAAVTYIENILTADHQKYHDMLVAEEDKRRTLLDMVLALENEKLQLETALIVEGRQQSSLKPRRSDASVAPGLSEIESPTASDSEVETAGPSMTEPLLDDEEGNESDIEDYEFHECESGAAAVSGGSSMSPSHSRAGSAAGMVVAGSAASTDIATALDKLTASSSEGQEMVLNKVPSPDWLSEQGNVFFWLFSVYNYLVVNIRMCTNFSLTISITMQTFQALHHVVTACQSLPSVNAACLSGLSSKKWWAKISLEYACLSTLTNLYQPCKKPRKI